MGSIPPVPPWSRDSPYVRFERLSENDVAGSTGCWREIIGLTNRLCLANPVLNHPIRDLDSGRSSSQYQDICARAIISICISLTALPIADLPSSAFS
ncbi:hypothetical protein DL95DRAFT_398865, partial [Leptodontidium sp. 2 PMI_412]